MGFWSKAEYAQPTIFDPVKTPGLDILASESMVFNRSVTPMPQTVTANASLMSGLYPFAHGVMAEVRASSSRNLSIIAGQSLSKILHEQGYCVGYIGKWHLGGIEGKEEQEPSCDFCRQYGFDYWHVRSSFKDELNPDYLEISPATEAKPQRVHLLNTWPQQHEAEKAIEFIANPGNIYRDPSRPFALFLGFSKSGQQCVRERWLSRYLKLKPEKLLNRPNIDTLEVAREKSKPPLSLDNFRGKKDGYRALATVGHIGRHRISAVQNYFATLNALDHLVGKVLATLSQNRINENTLTLFTSHRGELLSSHGMMGAIHEYEESYGVPLLIRWPSVIKPGLSELPVATPDIYPTLLGLIGLQSAIPPSVQGHNYAPAFLGQQQVITPQSSFWLNPWGDKQGGRGVRTERYTYCFFQHSHVGKKRWLFDNWRDPYQMREIHENQGFDHIMEELNRELTGWMIKTGDLMSPW